MTHRNPAQTLFLLLVLTITISCHHYYKVRTVKDRAAAPSNVDSLKLQNRYFVLRTNGRAFYLDSLSVSSDRKTLFATLDSLPPDHRLHLMHGRKGKMQYKTGSRWNDLMVLNEVHLFMHGVQASAGETLALPLDSLDKIEIIEKDRKRTTNSYVIGAIGYTAGAVALVGLIIMATKSSCPFISAYDGHDFQLQGEIYGGAIYPQLVRQDYLPLKMKPLADGTLQLKISNELQERQFTDFARLIVARHPHGTELVPDQAGRLYCISKPQPAVSATLNNSKDMLFALAKPGDNAIAYMADTTSAIANNTIKISFSHPASAMEGRLVLRLKNSYWLDGLYGELAKGFGSYYGRYIHEQQNQPKEKLLQWTRDQQIPLSVSVFTNHGWTVLTEIMTTGPVAYRNMVVPIALSNLPPGNLRLRLSTGFMFWEIDYAGIDFSDDQFCSVEELAAESATDQDGNDVLKALHEADGNFLQQPNIHDVTTLAFRPMMMTDTSCEYSYILHAKGYYEHVRHFTNKPNVAFLRQFKKANAFPIYGKALYRQRESENLKMIAGKN